MRILDGMFLSIYNRNKQPIEVNAFMLECKILLDGVDVKYCVTADEDLGYVDVYVKDSQGNFKVDELTREVITERFYGKVEIIDGRKNFEERSYIECEREVMRVYWPFTKLLRARHVVIGQGKTWFGLKWTDVIISVRYYVDGE